MVQKNNGYESDDLWIVINNKVLKFTGDKNSFFPFGYFVNNDIGGSDFTLRFAKVHKHNFMYREFFIFFS